MEELQKYRLHEGVPWDRETMIGFWIACVGSGLLLMGVAALVFEYPSPGDVVLPFFIGFLYPLCLNHPWSTLKQQHWTAQWFVSGIMIVVTILPNKEFVAYRTTLEWILIGLIAPGLNMLLFRVNWWFLWDNPSRRTLTEKIVWSIVYTGIPPLGLGMAFWRWLGFGVETPTTVFRETKTSEANNSTSLEFRKKKVIETIPENPALIEHAKRVKAARGRTRIATGFKNDISETI